MTDYGVAPLELNQTRDLAAFLSGLRLEDVSEEAIHAGRRGVLDWIGCALAGSNHPTITTLVSVLEAAEGAAACTVFGRTMKIGVLEAPVANGQMGHILDYDDTHMGGVVLHASSPILASLFALADRGEIGGRDLIAAYVAGFEAGVRAGQAAPDHHDGGWHLTGTLGSIAAGAAAARLLGLDEDQFVYALGIATTQAGGMQQNRGTMCKSFHAGKAAHNGTLAALLAQKGFDSSPEILEGKKGFCRIYSASSKTERILDQLGTRWEIANNGHKPYACGVVLHPAIDAMVDLGNRSSIDPSDVASVELRVHPHAVTITGVTAPKTGLQSKFSLTHTAAVSFIDRTAGIAQFSDARAVAEEVVALRDRINVVTDDSLAKDQAQAIVTSTGGETSEAVVEHATGTIGNPMSDSAIEAKFLANAEPAIGKERAGALRDLVWRLDEVSDLREITALCA